MTAKCICHFLILMALLSCEIGATSSSEKGLDIGVNIEATMIDVEVPLFTGFVIDGNEDTSIYSTEIFIINNTYAPVQLYAVGVSYIDASELESPKLVSPASLYNLSKKRLNEKDDLKYLSLRIYSPDTIGWLQRSPGVWFDEDNRFSSFWMGSIFPRSRVRLAFEIKSDNKWRKESEIAYEFMYKVCLDTK